jgi:hypothetical protein
MDLRPLYPALPEPDANMRSIFALQKQLEVYTRNVFDAWSEFTAATVQLEKAAVREAVDAATEQTKEFTDSLRVLEPPSATPKDSFFVCMIPVVQQLGYGNPPLSTLVDMRALLQTFIGELRESQLTATYYAMLKQFLKTQVNLQPRKPWEVYLGLALQKQEPVPQNATKEQLVNFVAQSEHGANIMTLRLFSEALQVKFLILSETMTNPPLDQQRIYAQSGFYITCLGTTQTSAQRYVLLLYDQARDYYALYYVFQADGSRRYVFALNTLPPKLINAYLSLCDTTDEVTDFEKAAPQMLLSTTTEATWSTQFRSQ